MTPHYHLTATGFIIPLPDASRQPEGRAGSPSTPPTGRDDCHTAAPLDPSLPWAAIQRRARRKARRRLFCLSWQLFKAALKGDAIHE